MLRRREFRQLIAGIGKYSLLTEWMSSLYHDQHGLPRVQGHTQCPEGMSRRTWSHSRCWVGRMLGLRDGSWVSGGDSGETLPNLVSATKIFL